jgi:hypothetical protein
MSVGLLVKQELLLSPPKLSQPHYKLSLCVKQARPQLWQNRFSQHFRQLYVLWLLPQTTGLANYQQLGINLVQLQKGDREFLKVNLD